MIVIRKLVLIILIGLLASSCAQTGEVIPIELNNSMVGQQYEMKSDFINTKTVTLYYPDLGYDNLLRIVKDVNILQGGSEVRAIANKLLSTELIEDDDYIVPFNNTVDLGWLIVSRNLVTINLQGDFSIFTEKQFFCSIVSIVNTLCELKNIDYVEILLNGEQLTSRGLIVNPMSSMSSSLHLMYLDHINIIDTEERKLVKDKNILYFLDKNSNFLIAEISNVAVSKENAADDLLKLLKNEPYYGSGIQSSIPQNVIMPASAVITNEDEQDILTVRLESPKYETMDNKTRYMMCGGITLTLLSYYDSIDALRIFINGHPALEENFLTKDMFIENIGQIVTVHMPNRDLEYLVETDLAMSQHRYNSPKERVREIVLADTDYKSNTVRIIPDSIKEEDILSVFVHDSCCVVNISEELYKVIIELPYKNIKMFVYSIVNTLTELENISSVQFLVEGMFYESLGASIYIETPMLNNPGIVFD